MGFFKDLFRGSRGLREKLSLVFCLMSVIPLLAFVYVVSIYAFPHISNTADVTFIVLAAAFTAFTGWLLAKQLVGPVLDMAVEAKMIADGEYQRSIAVKREDEIGNLAGSINAMTRKIRLNLDEIKGYSVRMKDINVEINKKVLALSSLLQIGDILSSGSVRLDSLLELALEKASAVFDTGYGVLYMPKEEGDDLRVKSMYNTDDERLANIVIRRGGRGVLERSLNEGMTVMIDKSVRMTPEMEDFKMSYGLRNCLIVPLLSGRRILGLLLVGNRIDAFKFKVDDVDLVKVFAKQITIAIESDFLSKRAETLAIKDDLTDLYNKSYLMMRLEDEIKRAVFYQRPCSLIIVNIDNFAAFRDVNGEIAGEEVIRRMARLVKDNVTPVSKIARVGGDEFAVLLPEKNKREATYIAEEMRKKIAATNLLREGKASLTVSCGVSENPIDGATGEELYKKALASVKQAKSSGRNKVVG